MSASRIRIKIYGTSRTARNRFVRQLAEENKAPAPPKSRLAAFLADDTTVCKNVDIKIGNIVLIVSDGESESPQQMMKSDALAFFFDPGGGAKHHADERLRAKQLIDLVLESRQNRLLPMVFVLTGRERWTPEQTRLADEWINHIDAYLKETYSKTLRNHFPPPLIRQEHVFHTITSVENGVDVHAGERLNVMENIQVLVGFASQFRRRDRRRSQRNAAFFFFCLFCIVGIPFFCFTSSTIQNALTGFHNTIAPILHLPIGLAAPEATIDLEPLFNSSGEIAESEARTLNRSLFFLMKKLNAFEDGGQPATDDDRTAIERWNRAAETIRDRFAKDSASDRLGRYGILLNGLTDTPKRQPRILNEVLKDYWTAYRQQLLGELRQEIAVHREASSPALQILSELCVRLETAFRDVSESGVRSDAGSGTGDETRKESLKQDIRKAFIACRNYRDRVPLEIVVVSASLESIQDIDHDIHRRLVFSGGQEKGEVFIDLTISTGFQSTKACVFLPSRKEFTLSFIPERQLRVAVQGKPKGSQGEWAEMTDWDLTPPPSTEMTLTPLGVPFYRKFENEENTSYPLFADGYKFELIVRRPRNVPELLWEIVDETP